MSSDSHFTFGERLGMVFAVQAGFLSVVSVSTLLAVIIYNTIRNAINRRNQIRPKWLFFRSSMDYLFVNLLFNDLIQSLGYVTIIQWVRKASVTPGPICTAQAVLQHVGDVGSAFATLAIAVHTFVTLMFPWIAQSSNRPWLMPLCVFGAITLFQLLMTLIPALAVYNDPKDPFYGEAGYWCWIRSTHGGERLGLEYVIFWFVALANITLYIPLFLALRGNLVVELKVPSAKWWQVLVSWKSVRNEDAWSRNSDQRSARLAKQMLAYPIVYVFLILPATIHRWASPHVENWPSEVTVFVCVVFALSGLMNVVLYVTTRPSLFPLRGCFARTGLVEREEDEENMVYGRSDAGDRTTRHQRSEVGTTVTAHTVEDTKLETDGQPSEHTRRRGAPMLNDDSSDDNIPTAQSLGHGNGADRNRSSW